MENLQNEKIKAFQKEIFNWYSKNKRDLPWREVPYDTSLKQRDPYRILVSEVMLQQTQVSRVIPKYESWMKKFPTVHALAKAQTSEVLRLWSGLGYNRRALYLQKTAKELVKNYSLSDPSPNGEGESRSLDSGQAVPAGRQARMTSSPRYHEGTLQARTIKWPRDVSELEKLPGIGKYTAGAVACFAFDQQIAVVDTNIRKVILTQFGRHPGRSGVTDRITNRDSIATLQNDRKEIASVASCDLAMTDSEIRQIAELLLPKGKAYEWNQALMDYASAMLKKEKIPIPKQSKFHGSNRYYRGKLLRLLLEQGQIASSTVGKLLKEDFLPKDTTWLEGILRGMERDELIIIEKESVALRNS